MVVAVINAFFSKDPRIRLAINLKGVFKDFFVNFTDFWFWWGRTAIGIAKVTRKHPAELDSILAVIDGVASLGDTRVAGLEAGIVEVKINVRISIDANSSVSTELARCNVLDTFAFHGTIAVSR